MPISIDDLENENFQLIPSQKKASSLDSRFVTTYQFLASLVNDFKKNSVLAKLKGKFTK